MFAVQFFVNSFSYRLFAKLTSYNNSLFIHHTVLAPNVFGLVIYYETGSGLEQILYTTNKVFW